MEIKTGGKDLLTSETFFAIGLGETTITFNEHETLCFIFNFIEDEDEKKRDVKASVVDNKTLKMDLTNWNSALALAVTEPVEVGTYRNRRLFIVFRVSKAAKEGQLREVTLSLYLGEKVQDGQN